MNQSFVQSVRDYRKYASLEDWSPKDLESWLHNEGGVVGQDNACRAASIIAYNHFEGRRSVNLFHGTTGAGKSYLWSQVHCYFNYTHHMVFIDGSALTAEGWKGGTKLSTIFRHIKPDDREKVLLVFDEFDKLLEPQYGANGTNYSDLITNQLLCLCSGGRLFFGGEDRQESIAVDCSHISVVFLGCFDHLRNSLQQRRTSIGFHTSPHADEDPEISLSDLIESGGMRRELAGRLTRIVSLSPASVDDYIRIGKEEITRQERLLHKKILCDPDIIAALANEGVRSQLGARYVINQLQCLIDDCIYDDCDADQYELSDKSSTRLWLPESGVPQFA